MLNIYDAMKSYKSCEPGKQGDWIKNNPDAWKIVKEYMDAK